VQAFAAGRPIAFDAAFEAYTPGVEIELFDYCFGCIYYDPDTGKPLPDEGYSSGATIKLDNVTADNAVVRVSFDTWSETIVIPIET